MAPMHFKNQREAEDYFSRQKCDRGEGQTGDVGIFADVTLHSKGHRSVPGTFQCVTCTRTFHYTMPPQPVLGDFVQDPGLLDCDGAGGGVHGFKHQIFQQRANPDQVGCGSCARAWLRQPGGGYRQLLFPK